MKSIKELCPFPSAAVAAMCEGLLEQSRREDFRVEMASFGGSSGEICFGCAATCTVQKIAKKNLTKDLIRGVTNRSAKLGFDWREQDNFEMMINSLRCGGDCFYLFRFYGLSAPPEKFRGRRLDPLETHNWRTNLPQYENLAMELKEVGF